MDEDIILYSENFGIKMLDLMAPDLLQTYSFSEVKFHDYFVNLPFHTIKLCLTKISPEKIVAIVKSRPNLEISSTKGVLISNASAPLIESGYFCISLSQISWFGDQVGIQISGICPISNRL